MLNRVLSESDIDDVRYHIIFEMAMETYILITPIATMAR